MFSLPVRLKPAQSRIQELFKKPPRQRTGLDDDSLHASNQDDDVLQHPEHSNPSRVKLKAQLIRLFRQRNGDHVEASSPTVSMLSRLLDRGPRRPKISTYTQNGRIVFLDDQNMERIGSGLILFDTGCTEDLVSSRFLAHLGIALGEENVEVLGLSVTGEAINSIGKVTGRWSARGLSPRYYTSSFRILNSDTFDVIVGEESISRLKLFQPSLIGAIRPQPFEAESIMTGADKKRRQIRAPQSISSRGRRHETTMDGDSNPQLVLKGTAVENEEGPLEANGVQKDVGEDRPNEIVLKPGDCHGPVADHHHQVINQRSEIEVQQLDHFPKAELVLEDLRLLQEENDDRQACSKAKLIGPQPDNALRESEFGTPTATEYSSYTENSDESEDTQYAVIDTLSGREYPELGVHVAGWLDGIRACGGTFRDHGENNGSSPAAQFTTDVTTNESHGKRSKRVRQDDTEQISARSGARQKRRRKEDLKDPKVAGKLLACPFVKLDPMNHQDCWNKAHSSCHYLKTHLREAHYDPTHCPRCGEIFFGPTRNNELNAHLLGNPCALDPSQRWFGIDADRQTWLSIRKSDKVSEEQYWMSMYKVLFVGEPPPQHPYMEDWMALTITKIRNTVIHDFTERERLQTSGEQPSIHAHAPRIVPGINHLNEAFDAVRSSLRSHALQCVEYGTSAQQRLDTPLSDSAIGHTEKTSTIGDQNDATDQAYLPSRSESSQAERVDAVETARGTMIAPGFAPYTRASQPSASYFKPPEWSDQGMRMQIENLLSEGTGVGAADDFGTMVVVSEPLTLEDFMIPLPPAQGYESQDTGYVGNDPGPIPSLPRGQSPWDADLET